MIVKKTSFLRRNEKGQVAIFVALIFQVIFVFFALLINVGLLVHHKINLQHSTDLAAYYGAMKQAEQMNAIAHINFQLRQAWKLMTWRYRVLGTFGFIKDNADLPRSQNFAFNINNNPGPFFYGTNGFAPTATNKYLNGNGSTPPLNCSVMAGDPNYQVDGFPVGIQDVPFFCIGHSGFAQWPQGDTSCQLSCPILIQGRAIGPIQNAGASPSWNTGTIINQTTTIVTQVNYNLQQRCELLAKTGADIFATFILGYANEFIPRSNTIKMLAKNLSNDADVFLDIEGQSIKEGSRRTFKNNLTEANFTGWDESNGFQVYNGLSDPNCRFQDGNSDNTQTEFLKKISFKLLNFFIYTCKWNDPRSGQNYLPVSLYTEQGTIHPDIAAGLSPDVQNTLLALLDAQNYPTIGYEKNPHCVEYFAVKASSEPNIPFLPISKIKLNAVATAKPFGGNIGPWYGKTWNMGEHKSFYIDSVQNTKTDEALPMRDFIGEANAPITRSVYTQPNFSLFVGDALGVRNLDYLAANHSMLVMRDIADYGSKSYSGFRNTLVGPPQSILRNPNLSAWPSYSNWNHVNTVPGDLRQYDSLAIDTPSAAGTRALEIAAIAPNQFDIYHYSIDPDFYNNYYVKLYRGFNNLNNSTGGGFLTSADLIRPDFGAIDVDVNNPGANQAQPLSDASMATFSVKDQILLKNTVLRNSPTVAPAVLPPGASGGTYSNLLNYLVKLQSSLLTSWTFTNFENYQNFPAGPINRSNNANTMAFGHCDDDWNKTSRALGNETNSQDFQNPTNLNRDNPSVPGNCVTGGRTGYSVKIVTPQMVSNGSEMLNPLDLSFLQF